MDFQLESTTFEDDSGMTSIFNNGGSQHLPPSTTAVSGTVPPAIGFLPLPFYGKFDTAIVKVSWGNRALPVFHT